jgi:mannose-1-phosphate guanylyltransferase / phosphomannomutase
VKKAVFLDRDGVINENVENLTLPEQMTLIAGSAQAIKRLNKAGYLVVVVTNQPIIAKGFCTFGDMERIHDRMRALLAKEGARVDSVYLCPHHPQKGFSGEVPDLKLDCGCRKPKPGLLLKAIGDLGIDAGSSWMVGDSYTDVAAGKKAGVRTILIGGGGKGAGGMKPDECARSLGEAADIILSAGL